MRSIARRKDPKRLVRFPGDLLQQIDKVAAKNGRSGNSEIVVRLQGSFDKQMKTKKESR